jgi:hypothetical protein
LKFRVHLARWRRRARIARLEWLSRRVPRRAHWIQRSDVEADAPEGLVVVCLARDSEPRVSAFLDYYLRMGARHVVLVDNDSADQTVARACQLGDRVSVLRCDLDFRRYQVPIKMWMSRRFCGAGWVLIADVDEYLAYPFADDVRLGQFLQYLNLHSYSGVVLQTVDLFSPRPSAEWPATGEALRRECVWYDHSQLSWPKERHSFSMNQVSNPAIRPCLGGIKRVAFGVDRLLTKHVLIRPALGARLNGPHHSRHASIADVSAALLHYPFDRGLRARGEEALRRRQYWGDSREFRAMLRVQEAKGAEDSLAQATARRLESVNQLVEEGYLVVSDSYRRYVEERRQQV